MVEILNPFTDASGQTVAALVSYPNLGTTGFRDIVNNRSLKETVTDVSQDGTAIKVDLPIFRGGTPYRSIEGGEYKFISEEEWDRRNRVRKTFQRHTIICQGEYNPKRGERFEWEIDIWMYTNSPLNEGQLNRLLSGLMDKAISSINVQIPPAECQDKKVEFNRPVSHDPNTIREWKPFGRFEIKGKVYRIRISGGGFYVFDPGEWGVEIEWG